MYCITILYFVTKTIVIKNKNVQEIKKSSNSKSEKTKTENKAPVKTDKTNNNLEQKKQDNGSNTDKQQGNPKLANTSIFIHIYHISFFCSILTPFLMNYKSFSVISVACTHNLWFGLKANVKEGSDNKTLKNYIGHIEETSLYDGNIGLAAHNRGNQYSYFARINELEKGDIITYQTKFYTRNYKVFQ